MQVKKQYATEGFSVADLLEERAEAMKTRRKRVRTRAMLLAVAAREIEKVGYDSLTIDHLASAAGMVRGTFYLHFSSRSDIILAVLRKYWTLLRIHRPRGGRSLDLKTSIHRANTYSVMLAVRNPRLLEARELLLHENSDVAKRMKTVNWLWSEWIIRDLVQRGLTSPNGDKNAFLRLKVRAVIKMSDTLLADVNRFSGWDDSEGPIDLQLIIRVMNDLWYRSLYMPEIQSEECLVAS